MSEFDGEIELTIIQDFENAYGICVEIENGDIKMTADNEVTNLFGLA